MHFCGGLHIDGCIKGNVLSSKGVESTLTISENGVVEGEVHVTNLILNGMVSGDVHVGGRLELAPKARVNGNVYYTLIEIAIGAEVNGNLLHQEPGDPPMLGFEADIEAIHAVTVEDQAAS